MRRRTDPAAALLGLASTALMILVAVVLVTTLGCATTETVRVVREEVPVPVTTYHDLKDAPPETPLQSQRITPAEAQDDPQRALTALGDDLTALLEENATLRWLYNEAIKLCASPPTAAADAPTPDP